MGWTFSSIFDFSYDFLVLFFRWFEVFSGLLLDETYLLLGYDGVWFFPSRFLCSFPSSCIRFSKTTRSLNVNIPLHYREDAAQRKEGHEQSQRGRPTEGRMLVFHLLYSTWKGISCRLAWPDCEKAWLLDFMELWIYWHHYVKAHPIWSIR